MSEFDDDISEPVSLSSLKENLEQENVQEVDIDLKKKQTDNKATLNIKNNDFIKDFVDEPSRPAEDYGNTGAQPSPSSSSNFSDSDKPTETVEDIRKRLEQEEKEEISKLTAEDFTDMADFIIDLVDMGLLFGIRWYSMDISDAEYKVPEEKLKKLKKHLTRLLMRVGTKFPMGMLLVLGVIAAYATPVRKAHEHRKSVQAERTRKRLEEGTDTETAGKDEPEYVPIKKRKKKRGGQPK